MSTTTKVLSAQGAATVLPANSAVLTVDGASLLTPVTIAAIAAAVAQKLGIPAGAKVMKKVIIPGVDTDFNDLTDDMTTYSFEYDRPSGITIANCPKPTFQGGFSLTCLYEGSYRRQIAMFYQDNSIYMRCQHYSEGSSKWTPWSKIVGSSLNSGGVNTYHSESYKLSAVKKGGPQHEHSQESLRPANHTAALQSSRSRCIGEARKNHSAILNTVSGQKGPKRVCQSGIILRVDSRHAEYSAGRCRLAVELCRSHESWHRHRSTDDKLHKFSNRNSVSQFRNFNLEPLENHRSADNIARKEVAA